MKNASPLRYPGGKWRLAAFFERLISLNFEEPPTYVEPYAGGASLALTLLFRGAVNKIYLNDLDPAIYACWHSMLHDTARLIQLVETMPLVPSEWSRQKEIFASGQAAGRLRLGFATFYLNRTNHSGILNGGMIGGKSQLGEWKLDARFNRGELVQRIRRIAANKDRIHLSNLDACNFVKDHSRGENNLLYLDPPYYRAGQRLYLNAYSADGHTKVRDVVLNFGCPWVVSYDDVPEIRNLYGTLRSRRINLLYTARGARQGREIMFFSPGLKIPAGKRKQLT
jgi:DNA adenine methylase